MFTIEGNLKVNTNEYITTFVINRVFDRLVSNDLEIAALFHNPSITLDYTKEYVKVYENEYVGQLVLNRVLNKLFLNDLKIFDRMVKSPGDRLPFSVVEEVILYENEYFSTATFNRCVSRLYANDDYLNLNSI